MIPPLLDEETIQAIKEQAAANKTYERGVIKYKYLLSRVVFCQHCGYALMAQTNHNGKQYFRHPRHRKKECTVKNWVPAEPLGKAVLLQLFQMFGDVERIEKAIQKATPDLSKIEKLRGELADLKDRQNETIQQRKRLVKLAATGALTEEEVRDQIQPIRTAYRQFKTGSKPLNRNWPTNQTRNRSKENPNWQGLLSRML